MTSIARPLVAACIFGLLAGCDPGMPFGDVCARAGGKCVPTGTKCSSTAPSNAQDCNPNPPNPGNPFCCLRDAAPDDGG